MQISDGSPIDISDLIGRCVAILGIRGSGKTNTSAVLAEELLEKGLPLTVVDVDGEYWGLKQSFEILVAGRSSSADLVIGPEHGGPLAKEVLNRGIPVILDVSGFIMDDINSLLYGYFMALWRESETVRRPHHIVIEEAHEFVPQGVRTDLKEILTRIALRGRKRGLGLTLVSQRSAKVEKDLLTQAEMLLLHKVVHPADLRVYKDIIPWPGDVVEKQVMALTQGEAIFLYGERCEVTHVRRRRTYHPGFTPGLDGKVVLPKLRNINADLLSTIQVATKSAQQEKETLGVLEDKIKNLRLQLNERDKTIERLQAQVDLLSKIEIRMVSSVADPRQGSGDTSWAGTGGVTAPSDETPAAPLPLDKLSSVMPPTVKTHLERVTSRLMKLNDVQQAVLKLLVSRYPSSYTYSQMASWTGYSESTLYKNNLTGLVSLGLITRERKADGYYFRCNLAEFVDSEFSLYIPQIGRSSIPGLVQSLRNWICDL